jgi:hypothetical protein
MWSACTHTVAVRATGMTPGRPIQAVWATPRAIVWQPQCRHLPRIAIFVFRSDKDRRQVAFASDDTGKALPEDLSPWHQTSNRAVPSFVAMPASFQDAVAAHGCVVLQIARKVDPAVRDFRVPTRRE